MTPDSRSRLQRTYDQIAADYARTNAVVPVTYREHLGPEFLKLASLARERLASSQWRAAGHMAPRVLDAGCGAGRDMAWFEENGAKVLGADLSWGMLGEARTRCTAALVQLDLRALAFRKGAFDGVWCAASLLHLSKVEAPVALREIRRVLAADGALMLALQAGQGEGWEMGAYGHPVERFFARYSIEEAASLLEECGFVVQEQTESESGTRRWLRFVATRG